MTIRSDSGSTCSTSRPAGINGRRRRDNSAQNGQGVFLLGAHSPDCPPPPAPNLPKSRAGVQLFAMLSDPETVRRMVAPGLVAAILGTGSAASLGLEEAYRSYAMRLAFNGAMALLFYIVPTVQAALARVGV
jgi:hypothetical protein